MAQLIIPASKRTDVEQALFSEEDSVRERCRFQLGKYRGEDIPLESFEDLVDDVMTGSLPKSKDRVKAWARSVARIPDLTLSEYAAIPVAERSVFFRKATIPTFDNGGYQNSSLPLLLVPGSGRHIVETIDKYGRANVAQVLLSASKAGSDKASGIISELQKCAAEAKKKVAQLKISQQAKASKQVNGVKGQKASKQVKKASKPVKKTAKQVKDNKALRGKKAPGAKISLPRFIRTLDDITRAEKKLAKNQAAKNIKATVKSKKTTSGLHAMKLSRDKVCYKTKKCQRATTLRLKA